MEDHCQKMSVCVAENVQNDGKCSGGIYGDSQNSVFIHCAHLTSISLVTKSPFNNYFWYVNVQNTRLSLKVSGSKFVKD